MKTLTIQLLVLLTLSMASAHARLSNDLRNELPSYTRNAKVTQRYTDGVVVVKGAEIKADLYAKPIFLEVEIADVSHTREIYVVNSTNGSHQRNRNTQAEFISNTKTDPRWMSHGGDSSGTPQVIYVGRGENNTSRFIILAPGLVENTYINIYVKMDGRQFSTQVYVESVF